MRWLAKTFYDGNRLAPTDTWSDSTYVNSASGLAPLCEALLAGDGTGIGGSCSYEGRESLGYESV